MFERGLKRAETDVVATAVGAVDTCHVRDYLVRVRGAAVKVWPRDCHLDESHLCAP